MVGKGLPDFPVVRLDHAFGLPRQAISPLDAQRLQGYSLGVEHAEDIMVGNDEQVGGRPQGCLCVGQKTGIDMAVRAYEGQSCDGIVQLTGDTALPGIGGEETIGIQEYLGLQTLLCAWHGFYLFRHLASLFVPISACLASSLRGPYPT